MNNSLKQFLRRWLLKYSFPKTVDLKVQTARILSGPFEGVTWVLSSSVPKMLGTYERELRGAVKDLIGKPFKRIVIAGAGDGYYAIGLGVKHPSDPEIIAFDMDAECRASIDRISELNGLARIDIRGRCEVQDLISTITDGPVLLICDTEGYEKELLDPVRIPKLTQSWILVEVHDFVEQGVAKLLSERFSSTHDIEEIWTRPRSSEDVPPVEVWGSRFLRGILARGLDEGRPSEMRWYWMTPKLQ